MIKTLIFVTLINWIVNQTVTVNNPDAPATWTKSTSLIARMAKSPCLDKFSEIIGCMSPCQQELWVQANIKNQNTTVCLDCSTISKDRFKSCVTKNINGIGKGVSKKNSKVKDGLTCLSKFKDSNFKYHTNVQNITKTEMDNIDKTQKKGVDCFKNFLASLGTVGAQRRKLLCLPITDLNSMCISTDASGRCKGFKFNVPDATTLTKSINDITYCAQQQSTQQLASINNIVE
jgi:hypothetical protein